MTVRSALPGDIEDLIEIANAVAAEDRWVTPGPGDGRFTRDYWLASIGDPNGTVFVATRNNAIAGFVKVNQLPDGRHHFGMMVRIGNRRQGFGKALLDAAVRWTRDRGIEDLWLTVYAHNAAARELYRTNGFHEVEVLPGHCVRRNGDVWDALVMVRPLKDR